MKIPNDFYPGGFHVIENQGNSTIQEEFLIRLKVQSKESKTVRF